MDGKIATLEKLIRDGSSMEATAADVSLFAALVLRTWLNVTQGSTPLHVAAMMGNTATVEALLRAGANLEAAQVEVSTARTFARPGHWQAVVNAGVVPLGLHGAAPGCHRTNQPELHCRGAAECWGRAERTKS